MNKSPGQPKYESSDHACYEFDPQVNFSQFLEEARQHHARETNFQRSSSCSEETGKRRLEGEKKNKKSWKTSLLSWWKIDRKTKPNTNSVSGPNIKKPSKGHGSGPLCGSARAVETRRRRSLSGPVSILFNPTRKVENLHEVPYMSLDQPNDPYQIDTYGPVYLVT